MLDTENFYKVGHDSYTSLSEDLLADLEIALDQFCSDLTFIYHDNEKLGRERTYVPPVDGQWVSVANCVSYAHGQPQGLAVYVVCDTNTTAAHLAYVCNFCKLIPPTTW
jgi:hypothetical protein